MPKNQYSVFQQISKTPKSLVENEQKFQDDDKYTKIGTNTVDRPRSGASNSLIKLILWKTRFRMSKTPSITVSKPRSDPLNRFIKLILVVLEID